MKNKHGHHPYLLHHCLQSWCTSSRQLDQSHNLRLPQTHETYFAYKAHETSHVFEANVGYDFGPVALNWYTNFAGNDGHNKDGDRAYSSYVEATAPFKLGGCDWEASVGAVPFATSFYGEANGFAVTHVGVKATKDLKITDSFSVPVFAQVAANPSTEKAYLVVGFTLQP